MSVTAAVTMVAATALEAVLPTALLVLATGGLVGMSIKNVFDSLLSDDGGEPTDEELADGGGGDGLMGESADDDFGDLGELEGGDDAFDDDLGDDEFADAGSGVDVDELDHRVDEMEQELESISSTVSTVRTENEQISESVDEVEENVRKLLDIYEMVTRGVNPFADDVDAGMAGGGGDSSFGLFDEPAAEEGGELDDDLADADAEGFFDEDIDGDIEEDEFGEPPDEELEDDEFDEPGDEEGTSFEDLKDEYEGEEADDADEDDADLEDEQEDELDADEADAEDDADSAAEEAAASAARRAAAASSSGDGKPYLTGLPGGFVGDVVVVEWLEYLCEAGGYRETAKAIDYYESIGWIDRSVADHLQEVLRGFDVDGGSRGGLTIDDHTRSLQYISQLDGSGSEAAVLSRLVGGGSDGIQR